MTKVVAIHQPNFFPWLGFFQKIVRSHAFVFLDHVQIPKTGSGVWSNRVKLFVGGEARWVTAPIIRNYHGLRAINEIEFQNTTPWHNKMLKTIDHNYRKSAYFKEIFEFLEPLIRNPEKNISIYNTHAILAIATQLGLSHDKFVWSSQLSHEGTANQLLVSLVKAVDGTTYMCGGGADGYQDDNIFKTAGIVLCYQQFQHPTYLQMGVPNFQAGLSIIDALMNIGRDGVKSLLQSATTT